MVVETKFSIGDKVFFKKNNTIIESEVTSVNIYINEKVRVIYNVKDYYYLGFFFEYELFKTKKELKEYYKKSK